MNGMVMKVKKVNNKWFYYGIIFLFLLILCYLFPYSHDDWAWGSNYGMERLETHFKDYNGRWVGNFVVLALTRSNALKTLTMAFSLTFILFCINELSSKGKKAFLLPFFLFLSTPYLIFRQAIVWTAGFSNYVVSLVFVFLFIYLNKELFDGKSKDTLVYRIFFPLIGIVSALFVEHVTLYVLVLSLFSNIYYFIKNKKVNLSLALYFVGIMIGAFIMFSNSAYSNISSGSDTYRSIGIANFINSSITSYFTMIYKYLSADNLILNIVLSCLVLKSLYMYLMKEKNHRKKIYILSFVLVFFPIYNLILRFSGINIFLKYTKYISGILTIVYFICIFLSAFFVKDKLRRYRIIFALLSIIVLTAPLFVVTPIGGRCFFPMYAFWIWISLEFYLNNLKEENEYTKLILMASISVFATYLICIYGYVFKVYQERIRYIGKHKNEVSMVLPKLPYSKYMWYADPVNKEFEERFKAYYSIDSDIDITFVPYKDWKKVKK